MTERIIATKSQTPMTEFEARETVRRIRAGIEGIGELLIELDDHEGWRALGYPSWRECVQNELGCGKTYEYDRMRAARINLELSAIAETLPANEAQARELARIPDPETRAQVWTAVVEEHGERVTAADIRRAVSAPEPETSPNGMLPIVDLETGEVVHPTTFRIKTDEERARERRREVTRTFAETFSLLSSLLLEDRDQIAEMWEPSANTMANVAPLSHLWSSHGIRDVARRLERLADEVDKRGGRLG